MGPAPMNFATFDLNLLRVFHALLRERSVTRAGDRLALSQPAVSAALARLRHALGDELFLRQGNAMVPTDRALALAAPIAEALAALDSALSAATGFDPATAERIFTLSGADFFSNLLMPTLFERIAAVAPGITLRLIDNARGDVATLLGEQEVDIALEAPSEIPDWVVRGTLFPAPFSVIAAWGMPALAGVAEHAPIPLDLFCALPHALRSVDGSLSGFTDAALARAGRARRVMLALPHFHAVALAVARGRLIAVVPKQFADAMAAALGLARYAPPMPFPVPEISLYWHRRRDQDPAHRWLREQVTAAVAEIA
jgi:DNA-binding transcriptional LysR family regulator